MTAQHAETFGTLSKGVFGAALLCVLFASTARATLVTAPVPQNPQVTLAWDPVTNAVGYLFYTSADGVNFQGPIDTGATNEISFNGMQPGSTNYFYVAAYDANHTIGQPSAVLPYLVPGGMTLATRVGAHKATSITFSVAPGRTYAVQASTDLTHWTTLWQTTSTANQWLNYRDLSAANLQMRFYRLTGF
jgi:hypothetical protein